MPPFIHIGYFPKKVAGRPDWLEAAGVSAIRSVSECVSEGPEKWMEPWTHNELYVFSTIAAAVAVVPEAERDAYELHAYRMLPVAWGEGKEEAVALPKVEVEPLPADFQSVGFDVVSKGSLSATFGCSPLSCNSMAKQIRTNEHCLLDDLATAKRVALEFSQTDAVEPGPYYVVEVLVRSSCRDRAAGF